MFNYPILFLLLIFIFLNANCIEKNDDKEEKSSRNSLVRKNETEDSLKILNMHAFHLTVDGEEYQILSPLICSEDKCTPLFTKDKIIGTQEKSLNLVGERVINLNRSGTLSATKSGTLEAGQFRKIAWDVGPELEVSSKKTPRTSAKESRVQEPRDNKATSEASRKKISEIEGLTDGMKITLGMKSGLNVRYKLLAKNLEKIRTGVGISVFSLKKDLPLLSRAGRGTLIQKMRLLKEVGDSISLSKESLSKIKVGGDVSLTARIKDLEAELTSLQIEYKTILRNIGEATQIIQTFQLTVSTQLRGFVSRVDELNLKKKYYGLSESDENFLSFYESAKEKAEKLLEFKDPDKFFSEMQKMASKSSKDINSHSLRHYLRAYPSTVTSRPVTEEGLRGMALGYATKPLSLKAKSDRLTGMIPIDQRMTSKVKITDSDKFNKYSRHALEDLKEDGLPTSVSHKLTRAIVLDDGTKVLQVRMKKTEEGTEGIMEWHVEGEEGHGFSPYLVHADPRAMDGATPELLSKWSQQNETLGTASEQVESFARFLIETEAKAKGLDETNITIAPEDIVKRISTAGIIGPDLDMFGHSYNLSDLNQLSKSGEWGYTTARSDVFIQEAKSIANRYGQQQSVHHGFEQFNFDFPQDISGNYPITVISSTGKVRHINMGADPLNPHLELLKTYREIETKRQKKNPEFLMAINPAIIIKNIDSFSMVQKDSWPKGQQAIMRKFLEYKINQAKTNEAKAELINKYKDLGVLLKKCCAITSDFLDSFRPE